MQHINKVMHALLEWLGSLSSKVLRGKVRTMIGTDVLSCRFVGTCTEETMGKVMQRIR